MLPAAPTVAVGLLTAALAGTSVAAADDDDARAAAAASAGDDAALVCEDAIVCRRFHQKLKGFNLYLASSTSSRGAVPVFTRYRYNVRPIISSPNSIIGSHLLSCASYAADGAAATHPVLRRADRRRIEPIALWMRRLTRTH